MPFKNFVLKKDTLYFLIFLLFFLFLFRNFFFSNKVFYERDTTLIEIPTRKLCTYLLHQGNFALWTNAMGNGQPFLANPKHAVLYPSTFLYLFLPFFWAFKLHYLVHIVMGWLGLYFLCKSHFLSEKASFLGASGFVFSGIFLSSLEFYNHIAALCWMPWILLMLNKLWKNFIPRLLLISFLWALLILAGTPYIIIMTLIFGFFQTLFTWDKRKQKFMLAFLSLFISLFIVSAQLIPSVELWIHGDREVEKSSEWSLEMVQFLNLVFPHVLGNNREPGHHDYWGWHLFDKGYPLYYSIYFGFGIFILFLWGLKKPWDRRHYFLVTVFFFFFILSSGKYSPFHFLFQSLPVLSTIRYPVKYLTGSLFSLSLLSAIGFDNIFTLKQFQKKHIFWTMGGSLGLLFLYIIFKQEFIQLLSKFFVIDSKKSIAELSNSFFHGFVFLSLCSLILLAYIFFTSSPRTISWILSLFIIFELIWVNQYINPLISTSFFNKPFFLQSKETPLKIHRENYLPYRFREKINNRVEFHDYLRQSLFSFCGIGEGAKYIYNRDFFGIYDMEYHKTLEFIKKSPQYFKKTLKYHGCHYYIGHHPLPGLTFSKKIIEGYPLYFQKIPQNSPPYLVSETVKANSIENKLEVFFKENFDPSQKAIIEKELELNNRMDKKINKKIILLKKNPGKMKCSIETSQKSFLVWSQTYYPGWKAHMNGKRTQILKVNLDSMGIVIPPGKNEILLKYFPDSFRIGSIISLITAITVTIFYLIFILIIEKKVQK